VRSALSQTLTDLEVCICNDGSTDGTARVLQEQFGDEPRVRWVDQENRGIGAASNRALSICRGEYVLQLDSDDELLPNAAEVLAKELDADPALALVYGGSEIVDPSQTLYVRREVLPPPYDRFRALHGNVASHPRMFRMRDFSRTGGFDETLENAVDFDIYLKIAEQGGVKAVPELLYRYYIHGENTSVARRKQQFANHVLVAQRALARRGLDWEVTTPDATNPRKLVLRRRRRGWLSR
jgi:chondroitin synthase